MLADFEVETVVGESWAHASTNRVILFWKEQQRMAFLYKSPSLPAKSAEYCVTREGVRGLRPSQKRARDQKWSWACMRSDVYVQTAHMWEESIIILSQQPCSYWWMECSVWSATVCWCALNCCHMRTDPQPRTFQHVDGLAHIWLQSTWPSAKWVACADYSQRVVDLLDRIVAILAILLSFCNV